MSYTASVVDGVLDYDVSSSSSTSSSSGSTLEYEQFLQLLCAEMQYQDPLEPTSNTEYVAQLATFSQLEATLSLENTVTYQMANDLVGKTVIMAVTSSTTGSTTYVDGKVDYVLYQDDEIYLAINDSLYSIEYLDTVADDDYYEAMGLAKSIENMLAQLPDVDNITSSYETLITQITDIYDNMTSYQQGFVDDDVLSTLEEYRAKLEEVLAAEEAAEEETEDTSEEESDDTTEEV